MFMHSTEALIIKILRPTQRKATWLEATACAFSQAVQLGLDAAREMRASSRSKLHKVVYPQARALGLPADYARMAVNAAVSLARSYYGLRRSHHIKRVSFPTVNGSQGIGLGVNAYKVVRNGSRLILRVSTGVRGAYLWLVLCVPAKYHDRLLLARGDAKLFQRGQDWYVSLPVRVTPTPTVCDGGPTFIGVDLGIVRIATVSTPDRLIYFDGKAARRKREHFADLRRRYQRHRRTDRAKAMRGKERRWMRDLNHKISTAIVNIARRYDRPVLVMERLDGIRNRIKGSKRFNRMASSWAFRQLIGMIEYKATRYGIPVVFIDPRGTSKTCSRCGHEARANRRAQARFRCTACGFEENADGNAARNIAAAGSTVWQQGRPDTARPQGQTEGAGPRPDGVKECAPAVHSDPNLASPASGTPLL